MEAAAAAADLPFSRRALPRAPRRGGGGRGGDRRCDAISLHGAAAAAHCAGDVVRAISGEGRAHCECGGRALDARAATDGTRASCGARPPAGGGAPADAARSRARGAPARGARRAPARARPKRAGAHQPARARKVARAANHRVAVRAPPRRRRPARCGSRGAPPHGAAHPGTRSRAAGARRAPQPAATCRERDHGLAHAGGCPCRHVPRDGARPRRTAGPGSRIDGATCSYARQRPRRRRTGAGRATAACDRPRSGACRSSRRRRRPPR